MLATEFITFDDGGRLVGGLDVLEVLSGLDFGKKFIRHVGGLLGCD
jgi:hypothetical protein